METLLVEPTGYVGGPQSGVSLAVPGGLVVPTPRRLVPSSQRDLPSVLKGVREAVLQSWSIVLTTNQYREAIG